VFRSANEKIRAVSQFLFRNHPGQHYHGKEVISMQYSKPEIVLVGSAVSAIQSNLAKGMQPGDSQGGDFTISSAYESDE
jgi:hypothetical protein